MVSTDDPEIAEIAKKYGASVPFFRSEATANDYASTDDVIMEVLKTYEERGAHFDNFCCIYPTAPFVTGERLKQAMDLLADSDSVMPVVPFSYPPQRGLLISEEGFLKTPVSGVCPCKKPGFTEDLSRLRTVLCLPHRRFLKRRNHRCSGTGASCFN